MGSFRLSKICSELLFKGLKRLQKGLSRASKGLQKGSRRDSKGVQKAPKWLRQGFNTVSKWLQGDSKAFKRSSPGSSPRDPQDS